jgi:hypothetical protein
LFLLLSVLVVAKHYIEQNLKQSMAYSPVNVQIHYNPQPLLTLNTTFIYNGKDWILSTQDGVLVEHSHTMALHLIKGEHVVAAWVDYGTSTTPTHQKVRWNGKGLIALTKMLPLGNIKITIGLSDLLVFVHEADRPLPRIIGNRVACQSNTSVTC